MMRNYTSGTFLVFFKSLLNLSNKHTITLGKPSQVRHGKTWEIFPSSNELGKNPFDIFGEIWSYPGALFIFNSKSEIKRKSSALFLIFFSMFVWFTYAFQEISSRLLRYLLYNLCLCLIDFKIAGVIHGLRNRFLYFLERYFHGNT